MQNLHEVTEARIQKMVERLEDQIWSERATVGIGIWNVGGEPVDHATAAAASYLPFEVGGRWGGAWDTSWFRIEAEIPEAWSGAEVALLFSVGRHPVEGFAAEALAWREGRPVGAFNVNRNDLFLERKAAGGERHTVLVEAAANPWAFTPGGMPQHPDYGGAPCFALDQAELARFDREAWELLQDFVFLSQALPQLPEKSLRRARLRKVGNDACNRLDREGPAARAEVHAALAEAFAIPNGPVVHQISAIGHAHIDTAWLWPLRESIRKCARTFSTQLAYQEEYKTFTFGASQPVQYAWMQHHYPDIFERIRKRIDAGRWEVLGTMWVEADCNLCSGESLSRQLLHGALYQQEQLGVRCNFLWLPDVFGYAASLPQILKKAGVDYFFTQKLSWSQFNRFPHHTFLWEGIDGTRIFSHFPPSDTYNGNFEVEQIKKGEEQFAEHDRAERSLYAYGHGDGGGGPTRPMLERARRLRDCNGLPKVRLERAGDFFEKAAEETPAAELAVWSGELFLELHHGTYTTHARIKRHNRQCEHLLREAEWLDAMAECVGTPVQDAGDVREPEPERAVYDVFDRPRADARNGRAGALDRAWKLLLLNQFHDIIPGSSMGWVYRDAERDYETIRELCRRVREDALGELGCSQTKAASGEAIALNALGVERAEVVDWQGGPVWLQVPSLGFSRFDPQAAAALPEGLAPVTCHREAERIVLDNGLVRIGLRRNDGCLDSIVLHETGREALPGGALGNELQIHPDHPHHWEAWDVDIYYREQVDILPPADRIECLEEGPLRARVRIERSFGESRLRQTVELRAGSARIDFETWVDWQERDRLLKVAFPVAVNAEQASFDIPYGSLTRPTHENTSWDMAKFEVCGHKWADLSEGGFGLALLNDCKYGYDVHRNRLRLSLLRGTGSPDPDADRGEQRFTYAILPHTGGPAESGVVESAAALNAPLCLAMAEAATLPQQQTSWFQVDRPGVLIETVKLAEREDSLIVRLYESRNSRGPCRLSTTLPFKQCWRASLVETTEAEMSLSNGTVTFDIAPYEIVTLKFPCIPKA